MQMCRFGSVSNYLKRGTCVWIVQIRCDDGIESAGGINII